MTRPTRPTPLAVRAAATLLLAVASGIAAPPPAAAQTAPRPSPDRVDVAPERGRAVVQLEGRDLDTFREARVVDARGGAAKGFEVVLGTVRGSVLPAEILTAGAAPGDYGLELLSEKGAVRVDLRLTVAAATAAVERVAGPAQVEAGAPFHLEVGVRLPSGAGKVVVTGGGREGSVEARGTTTDVVVPMPGLAAGAHTLLVQALDRAGGAAGEATHDVVVLAGPGVAAVTLSAAEATSGQQLTGTLTLDRPPGSDLAVALAVDASYVTVPATATVPAGSTAATFTVQVGSVPQDARTVVAATLGEDKAEAELTLIGPPVLVDFDVYGGAVSGSGQVMVDEPGAVAVRPRLDRPSPPGGTEVMLSTTLPTLVQLPASMTVPAGATELVIQVEHGVSPSLVTGTISAHLGSEQLDHAIRFEPPALPLPQSLTFRGPGIPEGTSVSVIGGVPLTAVVELIAPAPAGGVPIHFNNTNLNPVGGPDQVVPAGLQTFEIVLETPQVAQPRIEGAWVRAEGSFHTVEADVELLPVPSELVSLTFDQDWVSPFVDRTATVAFAQPAPLPREVVLSARFGSGSSWQGVRVTVPPGQMQASALAPGLGNADAAGSIDVTASYGGSSVQAALATYPAVQVQTLLLDPAVVYVGDEVEVEVVLQQPAPPGGTELVVQGLHSAILMPEPRAAGNSTRVTLAPGATSGTFVLEARSAAPEVTLSVANPLGGTMTRAFAIHEAVMLEPIGGGSQIVGGGGTRVFQLQLSDAPSTPTQVTLSTDRPDLVDLPATQTFVTHQAVSVSYEVLHDPAPGESIPLTISATLGNQTVSKAYTMVHSAPYVTAFAVEPMLGRTAFYPGDDVRLRWTLDRYPAQNTTIEILPEAQGVLVNLPPAVVGSNQTGSVTVEIGAFPAPGPFDIRARTGAVEIATSIPFVLPELVDGFWRVGGQGAGTTQAQLPLYGSPGYCVLVFDMPLPVMGELLTEPVQVETDRPDLVYVGQPATHLRFPHQAGSGGTYEVPLTCNVAPAMAAGLTEPASFTVSLTWRGQTRSITVTVLPEAN